MRVTPRVPRLSQARGRRPGAAGRGWRPAVGGWQPAVGGWQPAGRRAGGRRLIVDSGRRPPGRTSRGTWRL